MTCYLLFTKLFKLIYRFTCLGGNAEKYIIFTVAIKKKLQELIKIESELQFIDSARFVTSSLSNLVNNLSQGIHRIECKYGHNEKKNARLVELYKSIVIVFLNVQNFKKI